METEMGAPRLNANDDEVEVLDWYVEDKTFVEEGEEVASLESSKVAMDAQSPISGYILQQCRAGNTVNVGEPLALFYSDLAELEKALVTGEGGKEDNAASPRALPQKRQSITRYSKKARIYIEEHGIDLQLFEDMGMVTLQTAKKKAEISQAAPKSKSPSVLPSVEVSEVRRVGSSWCGSNAKKISRAKQLEINLLADGLAEGLTSSVTVQFYSKMIRDILPKLKLPEGQMLPLILFEFSRLLKNYPAFNAYYEDGHVIFHEEIHVAIATEMGKGLKAPVIRHAPQHSIEELFEATMGAIHRYLNDTLSSNDLTGGTVTVSDLSNDGVMHFQPLINKNQSVILGIGGDSQLADYPMTLTLVFDHRVLSGREASEFLGKLKRRLMRYTEEKKPVLSSPRSEEEGEIKAVRFEEPVPPSATTEDPALDAVSDDDAFSTDIAIIGMAGRFPGAKNIVEFWDNLKAGKESITFFSEEELRSAGVSEHKLRDPDYVKAKPVLDDVDCFDASFFNYTPLEAEQVDPQQRLLLEEAWKALEDAGYPPDRINLSTGLYLSVFWNLYQYLDMWWPSRVPRMTPTEEFVGIMSNDKDFAATRISYKLNLRGPSMTVQTACSSSLVAVHLACQSLLVRESDLALAGGSSLLLPQEAGYSYQDDLIYSPDGHCRAFDAEAKGTIFGNGVGIVALKRYSEAVMDGDHIYAVIKGSAVNNDGALKADYTSPGAQGQSEVIIKALELAQVNPESITYVEAHGTGTPIGDPLEIGAIAQAYRKFTQKRGYCGIGSVKTNIGHLNTAAGIASLIKTALSLHHAQLPPSLHFQSPNPEIDFETSPFYVNTQLKSWIEGPTPRRAGVSSFGIGGTNAHLVMEEANGNAKEEQKVGPRKSSEVEQRYYLVCLSAKTESGLEQRLQDLLNYFNASSLKSGWLGNISYTLLIGRRHFQHRCALVAHDIEELCALLRQVLAKEEADSIFKGEIKKRDGSRTTPSGLSADKITMGDRDDLFRVAASYVQGHDLAWETLFADGGYSRISLPTYPFCRERYWTPEAVIHEHNGREKATAWGMNGRGAIQAGHPLIHKNGLDSNQVQFTGRFAFDEVFIPNHVREGSKLIPGLFYLEMARASGELFTKQPVRELKKIVWGQPVSVNGAQQDLNLLVYRDHSDLLYRVATEGQQTLTHHFGEIVPGQTCAGLGEKVNLDAIRLRLDDAGTASAFKRFVKSCDWVSDCSFETIGNVYRGG